MSITLEMTIAPIYGIKMGGAKFRLFLIFLAIQKEKDDKPIFLFFSCYNGGSIQSQFIRID
ncbi:hypothetical protein Pse7429DRAFT_0641 [Pseudanabaena biceps PCC 7429]|uniref:Uncharacterized protein n=1 Tax=Pseudanabaena biceps PCC 7429 TaxID=927668 RepID=L8N4T8_9CYAN|nr:hypothetical protein Pse7429DRAFT_0641 [Pseudanabaena biceps PCC 7429]